MKSAMERRLGAVFGFGMLILFLIGVIQCQMIAKLADADRTVARTNETLENLAATQGFVSDAEAGIQGYLITGRGADLSLYDAALTRAPLVLQNLNKLSDATQRKKVDHLSSVAAAALAGLQKVAEARRQGEFAGASKLMASETTQKALDNVRQTVQGMEDEQRGLLEKKRFAAGVESRMATLITTAGSAVALWLLVLAGLVLRHYVTERRRDSRGQILSVQLLDGMGAGVYLSDETGMILYANPAAEAMFGYGAGELVGHNISLVNEFASDENGPLFDQIHEQLMMQGAWKGELPGRKREGTPITCAVQINAFERGGKVHWISVEEDVTERKLDEAPMASLGNELDTLEGIGAR